MKSFAKVHGLSIICKALDPVTLQSVNTETSFASIGLSTDAPAAAVTSLSLHRLYCAQRPLWLVSLCCTAASAVAGQFVLYCSVRCGWSVCVVLQRPMWLVSLCCTSASAVAGQFVLYCSVRCGWSVCVVLQRLLWLRRPMQEWLSPLHLLQLSMLSFWLVALPTFSVLLSSLPLEFANILFSGCCLSCGCCLQHIESRRASSKALLWH